MYLGAAIGQRSLVAAYRMALDGQTAPRLLFVEQGVALQFSPRGAILIQPRSWSLGCSQGGCDIAAILALELEGERATRRTLLEAGGRHAHEDRDSAADRAVHGMGQRQGRGLWLHWGDHLVLPGEGPPRAYSLERLLPRGAEWAGADRYEATPERLVLGVDRTGGRDFVSVDLASVQKQARAWGTRHGAR